jgi:hypothetical protein
MIDHRLPAQKMKRDLDLAADIPIAGGIQLWRTKE